MILQLTIWIFFSSYINIYVTEESIKEILITKVTEIEYWMKKVYDPNVIDLKEKASHFYKLWLKFKDQDPKLGIESRDPVSRDKGLAFTKKNTYDGAGRLVKEE